MKAEYLYVVLLFCGCFVSAFAQVLLKKAALKSYPSFLRRYLNVYVFCGYALFCAVLMANVWLMKFLPLSVCSAVSESLPLVLSFFTGRFFFGEAVTRQKVIGGILIVSGIVLVVL